MSHDESATEGDLAVIDQDFERLPVEAYKEEILSTVRDHQIVICIGETGSGKTTQIPQFLLDSGLGGNKLIGVTQPRRIAAISVSQRIHQERHGSASQAQPELSQEIGYTVRFDDQTTSKTKVKFMTDGILIRESLHDPAMSRYSILILDEAHERSLNTDILFGLLKRAARQRADLKIIIMSATLDATRFAEFFNRCPVLEIPGRVYPVDIYHSRLHQVVSTQGGSTLGQQVLNAAVEIICKIHGREEDGHILVFLTGQEEIESTCQMLRQAMLEGGSYERPLLILPLYAALPHDQQAKVFQKPEVLAAAGGAIGGKENSSLLPRKVVVATNIAETSITVPHVRYVIDCGYVKQKVYNPEHHMEGLVLVPVSKTAALQRAGRAGRTGPGHCYRLYSSDSFAAMMEETIPEIQRTNLTHTVLYLKTLGIRDVQTFDFLDRPALDQLHQALVTLHALQALNDHGEVTAEGKQMVHFPLDPHLSRLLLSTASWKCHCLEEGITLCAMLCVDSVWNKPRASSSSSSSNRPNGGGRGGSAQDEAAAIAHAGLRHPYGDFHSLLTVFDSWTKAGRTAEWCYRHFINLRSMRTAAKIRDHLQHEADRAGLFKPTVKKESAKEKEKEDVPLAKRLSHAITAAYFMHAATRCANDSSMYKCHSRGGDLRLVHVSPQCAFHFLDPPEVVVYQDLMQSTKLFMRMVARVHNSCLKEYQKAYRPVPVAQLSCEPPPPPRSAAVSSGSMEQTSSEGRKRPRQDDEVEETGTDSIERDQETVGGSSQQNAAVEAAKLRFLNRKKASTGRRA
eukprot:gene2668-2913_t